MHTTVLILVSAKDQKGVLTTAHCVANAVRENYPSFDYFSEDSFSLTPENMMCCPYDSEQGRALVKEYLAYQYTDFVSFTKVVKKLLMKHTVHWLYENDPELFRSKCYCMGSSGGSNIYFYDRYGYGLVKPEDVLDALKDSEDGEGIWLMPVRFHT